MSSALQSRAWNLNSSRTSTFRLVTFYRPNQDAGNYIALAEVPAFIITTSGYDTALPISEYAKRSVEHLLTYLSPETWSPESGDRRAVLTALLDSMVGPTSNSDYWYIYLCINGQFGPVYLS